MSTDPFTMVRQEAQRVSASPVARGFLGRLTPEQLEELHSLRREFQQGNFGTLSASSMARIIHRVFAERSIPVCGIQGLRSWLTRTQD